ncbi:MAG: alanyl-tRNA editing protein AlaXM [Nanoarchaeota archaeon]
MGEPLYFQDSYLKEFSAKVIACEGNKIALDQSAFYPTGGGQPHDEGSLIMKERSFTVVDTRKEGGKTIHEIDKEGLSVGDDVSGELDWERRYRLMRMHTAAHLLSSLIHKATGAMITGNQLGLEKSRIDFALNDFDRRRLAEWSEEANELLAQELQVNTSFMPREEALKIPELVKLKMFLPEHIRTVRIVEIPGVDIQACGGTHLKNIGEIGKIQFVGAENKGKNNRRVYYSLS